MHVYCTAFLSPHLSYIRDTTVLGSSKWSYGCGGDPCADVNKVSDVGCGEVLTSRRIEVEPNTRTLYSLSCINARCFN